MVGLHEESGVASLESADILAVHGLPAMLKWGEWKTPGSASAYVTWDEMDKKAMATLIPDESDDDI